MAKGGTEASKKTSDERNTPRAIIHKQILDHADANPNASMEAIADAISGATTATVERVLEKYGDPATAESDEEIISDESETDRSSTTEAVSVDKGAATTDGGVTSGPVDSAMTDDSTAESPVTVEQETDGDSSDPVLDQSSLTEKQRETLRAIYEHPDATQADLADKLGVSSPTISQRVNSIDGFDWSNRRALVTPLFDTDGDGKGEENMHPTDDSENANDSNEVDDDDMKTESAHQTTKSTEKTDSEQQLTQLLTQVERLTEQVSTVERELASLEQRASSSKSESSVLADPELAHKIIHACINSDRITEEEELRLLRDVTAAGASKQSTENSIDADR